MKYLSNLNLNRNQITNVVIDNRTTAQINALTETNARIGMLVYDTTLNELKVCTAVAAGSSTWDVVGKEYYLTTGISTNTVTINLLNADGDTNDSFSIKTNNSLDIALDAEVLTLGLHQISAGSTDQGALWYNGTTKANGQFYGGTSAPTSTTRLNYDGVFHAKNFVGTFNGLTITETNGTLTIGNDQVFTISSSTNFGTNTISLNSAVLTLDANLTVGGTNTGAITISSNGAGARTLILEDNVTIKPITNGHVLYASADDTINSEAQLATTRGGTGIGSYATGDLLYASATNTLSKLGIGSNGQVLRVTNGNVAWASGGGTDQALIIQNDGTNNTVFDGAAQRTLNFVGGDDISLTYATNSLTIDNTSTLNTVTGRGNSTQNGISVGYVTITATNSNGNLSVAGNGQVIGNLGTNGNLAVGGNAVIEGNLTVKGTTTTVDSTTVSVGDAVIELAKDNTNPLTGFAGLAIRNYDGVNDGAIVIDSNGIMRIGDVTIETNGSLTDVSTQPVLTREEAAGLDDGDVLIWDDTNSRAVGSTLQALGGVLKYTATIGNASATSIVVNHGLGTEDIQVTLFEVSTKSIVYADVTATNATHATIGFAEAPGTNAIKVVIIG
jgi:hypothetical protein